MMDRDHKLTDDELKEREQPPVEMYYYQLNTGMIFRSLRPLTNDDTFSRKGDILVPFIKKYTQLEISKVDIIAKWVADSIPL